MSRQPSLAEVLASAIESRLLDVHTAMPGQVMSYDPATQTCDVRPVVRRAIDSVRDTVVHEELPILPNVPVGWTRGGGYSFQLPLQPGDHVWLVFSEVSTASWRSTGDLSDPGDLRRHDLSYPVALPCVAPDSETLPGTEHALLSCPGGGKLSVSAGGLPSPVALASLVTATLTALKAAVDAAATAEANAGGMGGMNALKAALSAWPMDVAATSLEAE